MVAEVSQWGQNKKVVAGFFGAVLVWRGKMMLLMENISGYEVYQR